MAYIESLKEIILDENFTIIKFFRKIDLPFIQKEQAENVLYNALKTIESENNKQSMKAGKLLVNFNELINSNSVRDYWNSICIRNEKSETQIMQHLTKEKEEQEICHVRSNVLNEHIIESDRIIAGKRKSTDGYPPSKRTILTSANARINQDHSPPSILSSDFNHDHANCEEDIEPEYYDARKRHKIRYSWEDVIENIDFRDSSKKDWILQGYNLSDEFRNFQQQTIQQVKVNPHLCYKADVQKILCLSNIMMIERTKPSYFTCKSDDWNTICQRQPLQSLSSVAISVILEYSSLLNSFTPLDKIQKKWCANFSRITELNDQVDQDNFCKIQVILRNFLLLSSINTSNEDTFVHDTLHDLIKEIFRDSMLELVWANCGSSSSKSRRSSNKENARDLVKLANFQAGALDDLIMKYGNRTGMATYGIWVCGTTIRIYNMDLEYDGIYRMFLISEVIIPTEQAQFISLVPVLESFFNVKNHISEVLKIIASDTPPNSPSRSTYGTECSARDMLGRRCMQTR
ncbi:hypothetical protein GLOIN_2v1528288 [Rhizophagus clarus]|uniref:Uncharacterized protein n=1 Tax=Rhizophagus clarus TaxID=94130 RepID=A0A8H3KVJ5_9GLOM|nr:hypothetical protein GLOIN_2v1528288 [Rhizophagus clarus]